MKKIFCLFTLLGLGFFVNCISAQNKVGIGTATPTETLDINGNLNLNGQIKLDGDGGSPGEVLSVGADGNPAWAMAQQFTRYSQHFTTSGTMNIPADVDRVMIEAWGAGGGGALGGGGASGNYAMGVFDLKNVGSFTLNITVGDAGPGAVDYLGSASAGGFSSALATGINVIASGGNGANRYYGGLLPNNGFVAGTVSGNLLIQSLRLNGDNGQVTTQQTYQVAATTWHTAVHFGRGGHPPLGVGRGGGGSFRIHSATANPDGASQLLYQGGYAGIAAGGGGGQRLGYGWGWNGGRGLVIVRY